MEIFCRHKVPEEVKFILDQAQSLADREADTEIRKAFNTFNNEGAQKVDICLFGESLAWQWEKSRVCNHLDFNFLEIEEMIKQVGYKNWNRRTYDMFFKTGRDKNIDIDQVAFNKLYREEIKTLKEKRRAISSFFIKMHNRNAGACCQRFLSLFFTPSQSMEEEAAKMQLNDQEKTRLVEDYIELTKEAQKTNKVTSNIDQNFVLPDFQEILAKEQVSKNAIKVLFPDSDSQPSGNPAGEVQ